MKELIKKKIEELSSEFNKYVLDIYNNPELGNEEVYASKLLSDVLVKYGFKTKHPYVLETDFLGEYTSKKKGPKIGYLCEYDALPDVGHGCGHNLIGVTSILAAVALKEVIDEVGGSIHVFGTPAEENFGGKVEMAKKNVFDDMDVCMMFHPSSKDGVGGRTLAIVPIRFEFYGESAHGCRPYEGKNALDACVLTYSSISMMRQYVKPGCFLHGVITNGGSAANVVPPYACLDYYFRAPTIAYANELVQKAKNIATSCAAASGCTVKHSIYESVYEDTKINYSLAKALKEIMIEQGLDPKDVNEVPCGSSDVGAVSYVCPTIEGNIKICDDNINGHSIEFANCTVSSVGQKALKDGAICLAYLGLECITNNEKLNKIKGEFKNEK